MGKGKTRRKVKAAGPPKHMERDQSSDDMESLGDEDALEENKPGFFARNWRVMLFGLLISLVFVGLTLFFPPAGFGALMVALSHTVVFSWAGVAAVGVVTGVFAVALDIAATLLAKLVVNLCGFNHEPDAPGEDGKLRREESSQEFVRRKNPNRDGYSPKDGLDIGYASSGSEDSYVKMRPKLTATKLKLAAGSRGKEHRWPEDARVVRRPAVLPKKGRAAEEEGTYDSDVSVGKRN